MTIKFGRKFLLGALFATATTLTAAADTINVKLVNAGNPVDIASSVTIKGQTKSNVYIGPYTLSLNGQNVLAMCIDFGIDSYVGDTYTAYGTTVGSSNLSNTYASSYPAAQAGKYYEEQAYLYSLIVQPNADRLAIQEAAWNITAYGITDSSYTSQGLANNSYINDALANAGNMAGTYQIISDTTKFGEQEFIVDPPSAAAVTPEPSSFMLMFAPALAGVEALRRKRQNA